MDSLLQPMPAQWKGRKGVPLMMEFKVDPQLAPFLVSSSSSVMWVSSVSSEGNIRAAVRRGVKEVGFLFQEMVEAITSMGREAKWGNVHEFSTDGVKLAIQHVQSYDLTKVEILIHRNSLKELFGKEMEFEGVPVQPVNWLKEGTAIVLPRDRSYVGVVSRFGGTSVLGVVHNASRGVGIATR